MASDRVAMRRRHDDELKAQVVAERDASVTKVGIAGTGFRLCAIHWVGGKALEQYTLRAAEPPSRSIVRRMRVPLGQRAKLVTQPATRWIQRRTDATKASGWPV